MRLSSGAALGPGLLPAHSRFNLQATPINDEALTVERGEGFFSSRVLVPPAFERICFAPMERQRKIMPSNDISQKQLPRRTPLRRGFWTFVHVPSEAQPLPEAFRNLKDLLGDRPYGKLVIGLSKACAYATPGLRDVDLTPDLQA